jgi:hypothetical protein
LYLLYIAINNFIFFGGHEIEIDDDDECDGRNEQKLV